MENRRTQVLKTRGAMRRSAIEVLMVFRAEGSVSLRWVAAIAAMDG